VFCEGIPVLNNQKSWYFPYDRDRDPSHIDKLWTVFELGLDLADNEDDSVLPSFRTAFDEAMQLYGVAWNLTFGLYWCRPWSFLSLDERSRLYLSEKLRLYAFRGLDALLLECAPDGSSLCDLAALLCIAEFRVL
jgi:5-methylcytosine-specific restriction protein B